MPRREAFFAFLQERWPVFLAASLARAEAKVFQPQASYGLQFTGPAELPFDMEWLALAQRWAELLALRYSDGPELESRLLQRITTVQEQMGQRFTSWMMGRYAGLHNQPALPPVMLHHLPRYLTRRLLTDGVPKIALVVVDGLSLDQWVAVREILGSTSPSEFEMEWSLAQPGCTIKCANGRVRAIFRSC